MDIVERPPRTRFLRMIALRIALFELVALGSIAAWEFVRSIRQMNSGMGPRSAAMNSVYVLLHQQQNAWNEGDLDGFMLGYWNSPDLTFYSDDAIETGYEPLKQRYHRRYKAEGQEMGKLTFSDLEVQAHSPESAVVRGKWKVEKSKETSNGLFTLWVAKKAEGWRIVHDHTSAKPPPK